MSSILLWKHGIDQFFWLHGSIISIKEVVHSCKLTMLVFNNKIINVFFEWRFKIIKIIESKQVQLFYIKNYSDIYTTVNLRYIFLLCWSMNKPNHCFTCFTLHFFILYAQEIVIKILWYKFYIAYLLSIILFSKRNANHEFKNVHAQVQVPH